MPVTYNGIGTHYYGKKNIQTRPGRCNSCGRSVQLESYDTRLWFVVVFIPIIPLGRKRILDSCPSCRRHYVSDLEKWETARQLEVSGAMDKYRSNPSAENAIAAHQQLLGFHQVTEATEFQKTMVEQFPDSAKIHAYLGAAHEHLGRNEQATISYERALELRPDLPEARVGLARGYIREGRLGDARKMLDFLEKPGCSHLYSLEPLETLAYAYQRAGQHQEALDLFGKIMEELPKIAEHQGFRKAVKKSEKALSRDRTILPKQKFSLKRIFETGRNSGSPVGTARALIILGVIAALVILGFGIANEYIRRHRKIYLVNSYDVPATVEIPGVGEVKNFKGMRVLSLPEGHFHAAISGPVRQELDFDVRDSYFSRWGSDSLWLINVGGGALLELEVATYSQNPQPPDVSFHTGKPFEKFSSVTHPFAPLPHSVKIDSGGSRTLVKLDLFDGGPFGVFAYYEKEKGAEEALKFAETWLRAHPDDDMMLRAYAAAAEHGKQQKRLDAFLRAGMTNRPVAIGWHRAYQTLHDNAAEHAALVREYDDMLHADPTNSALLYLRGRLEMDRSVARDYFTRAANADPRNPYAVFALGYAHSAAGDWKAAKPLMTRAVELSPRDPSFANWLFITRLALGEGSELEQEARKKLARDPLGYLPEFELLDALAAQDKTAEVLKACNEFGNLCQSRYGASGQDLAKAIQYHAYYAAGDFDKLKSAAMSDREPSGRTVLAMALVEQGQVEEAAKAMPADIDSDDKGLFSFAFAAVYRRNGNEMAAAQWRSRGIEILRQGNEDCIQAAEMLGRSGPPTRAELADNAIPPQLKAVILTMLSQEYPQARAELAAFARELNVGRGFPYHLVRRLTAQTP